MNAAVQNLLVAVLVIAAALYAAWLILPARSRLGVMQWVLRMLPAEKKDAGVVRKLVMWLTNKASRQLGSACDRCSAGLGSEPKRPH